MNASPDLFITAVKMLLALGATVGVILLAFKLTRGMVSDRMGKSGPGMVKVLSSTYIGVKKSISLVEVPGAVLVLGISGESISLLTKIEDPVTLDAIRNPASADSAKFTSAFGFAQKIVRGFSDTQKGLGREPSYGKSPSNFKDFFNGSREAGKTG